jgi:diacylglycerol O-acyltransferase / wax synthase
VQSSASGPGRTVPNLHPASGARTSPPAPIGGRSPRLGSLGATAGGMLRRWSAWPVETAASCSSRRPTQTSVCVDLAIFAPATDEAPPLTLDRLRTHVAEHLHLLPSWRWRLESVPLHLHHPVFVDDPDFDLDYHLRERTLPNPGGDARDRRPPRRARAPAPRPAPPVVADRARARPRRRPPSARVPLPPHHRRRRRPPPHARPALPPVPDDQPTPHDERWAAHAAPPLHAAARRAARAGPQLARDPPDAARHEGALPRGGSPQGRPGETPPVPRSIGDAPWTVLNRSGPPVRTYARTLIPLEQLQHVRGMQPAAP